MCATVLKILNIKRGEKLKYQTALFETTGSHYNINEKTKMEEKNKSKTLTEKKRTGVDKVTL